MTASEMSLQFDILWNNIASDRAPGLNTFEKSIFLTKAQNELVKNYFDSDSKGNSTGKGFDDNAIRQMDFSNLMESLTVDKSDKKPIVDKRALVYELPKDVFIIINEEVYLSNFSGSLTDDRQVYPLNFQEYMRLMSKPFKEPLKRQAWRLMAKGNTTAKDIEIVLTSADLNKYNIYQYIIRYVRKPKPIIIGDFDKEYIGEGLSIEGYVSNKTMSSYNVKLVKPSDESDEAYQARLAAVEAKYTGLDGCELDDSVHDAIVQRAVELAKVSWEGDINQTQLHVTSGKRSE